MASPVSPSNGETVNPNLSSIGETLETKQIDPSQYAYEDFEDADDLSSEEHGRKSSSSDSESEEEDKEKVLETLEKAVAENPREYDSHVQYIKALRKVGHIEKLREARESMQRYFPLTPTMWQEWAKDEASLNTGSEAFALVEKIYEQGVEEYLSVSLWCDYLNFIQENDPSVSQCTSAGVAKMRTLFEKALVAAGLHVAEGSKIWGAYREFEQAYHLIIDDHDVEEKAKQVERIRSIFRRQLAVPLTGLGLVLDEYKLWEMQQGENVSDDLEWIPPNVAAAYQKALQMCNARIRHEELISSQNTSAEEKLHHFLAYIKFEESSGDPIRVQLLYERAIADFPISSDLWLGYTSYLDKSLKVSSIIKSVYSRTIRNCTWKGELWTRCLLALERFGASEEELCSVFEQSLQCSFSTIEEYLDLFLTRIDGLRRRILQLGTTDAETYYALIRDTFQRARDYLSQQLSPETMTTYMDYLLRLHAYWARLESRLLKDQGAARSVWESLIKTSGSALEVWQGYINMEIELNNIHEARFIYKRCYSKRFQGYGSEEICHSWLRFEREFGNLEDLDHAIKKVTPRLEELQLFRIQQEEKSQSLPGPIFSAQPTNSHTRNERSGGHDAKKRKPDDAKKRKPGIGFADKEPYSKRHKDATGRASKGDGHQDTGPTNKPESSSISKGVSPEGIAKEQLAREQKGDKSKKSLYTDQCTAFISNLNLQATEENLRQFFSDCGGIKAVRLLLDKFTGKSRVCTPLHVNCSACVLFFWMGGSISRERCFFRVCGFFHVLGPVFGSFLPIRYPFG
ncbi:squamous cell carcinoma antigen recognized by T-cells 3 [Amborella trichopoda]|uniref:squamous cell carcinoma antigen recognized by T-cells 3 n=1 Tax=Amborella trichopoda TaxID=13333 RepID=UPI0009BFCEDE|nr:squamous cell carcinoma antigen recognized by T-cells 3 [Amborella trichopoda]|eukprot:XP_020519015.1 squamous cell carcinoma antigen recognized by T-cells 3 [Amborella trichopoda]